jgi:hypothetical protein
MTNKTDCTWLARTGRTLQGGFGLAVAAAVLVWLTACKSTGAMGDASLTIQGVPIEKIRVTTSQVFSSAGYTLKSSIPQYMDCEKAGTTGDAVLYGGWDRSGVTTRVRVRFDHAGEGAFTLVATVYSVRDAGDLAIEEETRKPMLSRSSYRKLLEDVKAKCAGTGTK